MWTLKEAYVKACGAGLTVPFTDVCFKFQGDTGVSLSFASGRADDPSRWRLWCLKPTPVTTLAVAVADHHDDVALRLFRGIPMIGFEGVPAQFHRVCHPSPR
jgi:4'-phosphopantetheinyl transferase